MNKIKKKNTGNIIKIALFIMSLFTLKSMNSQVISDYLFGQNAWMPDTIGSVVYNGKLHKKWGEIADSKAGIIRFGGIAPDKNKPTNYQYIRMIDSIRAKGMEPMMQVSFHKTFTAQQAADVVHYVNVVKGKNVKYWVIGNEPDLEYGYTSAAQVAAYIKPFASAMKNVDPSILTIGPECAWFNKAIIDGLTTPNGPYDITGKDAAGRYYIDIVSFHYYPFNGTQTRSQVISKINSAGGIQDNLAYLNGRLTNCNVAHNRTGEKALRPAVTECNVNFNNPSNDNLYGLGVNSFIGGQFIAEMFAAGMKNNVFTMNMWSVVEGNSTALNIGYIDPNGTKKPAYYHYQMMAEHFKGSFASGTTTQANVKAFASKTNQNITVMVMNQDQSNNYNFTVKLNNNAVSGSNPLKININTGVNAEYSGSINNQSSVLLVFNMQGALVKKVEYSLGTHAVSNIPPTVTIYNAGGIATNVEESAGENGEEVNLKGFHINLFPNPAKSKFTVELDRRNPQEKKFRIELFDLMGRKVYERTTVFMDKKQELDLSGSTLASAVYIVRVFEEDDKDNVRSEKIILFS